MSRSKASRWRQDLVFSDSTSLRETLSVSSSFSLQTHLRGEGIYELFELEAGLRRKGVGGSCIRGRGERESSIVSHHSRKGRATPADISKEKVQKQKKKKKLVASQKNLSSKRESSKQERSANAFLPFSRPSTSAFPRNGVPPGLGGLRGQTHRSRGKIEVGCSLAGRRAGERAHREAFKIGRDDAHGQPNSTIE